MTQAKLQRINKLKLPIRITDAARLTKARHYILITEAGVYIHANWRGMRAEVQVDNVMTMQRQLDKILKKLQKEDPVIHKTRQRIKKATAKATLNSRNFKRT